MLIKATMQCVNPPLLLIFFRSFSIIQIPSKYVTLRRLRYAAQRLGILRFVASTLSSSNFQLGWIPSTFVWLKFTELIMQTASE